MHKKKQAARISEESPFGVLEFLPWNADWNNYKYPDRRSLERAVALMKEAGISWVRMDFLWEEIEPRQGSFAFSKHDALVKLLNQNDIHVLGILNYCAPWASDSGQWNSPPKNDAWFVAYAAKVITHYTGKVEYWEIWNEPDSPVYWSAQDGLKRYGELLKKVYQEAKRVNPQCKILNGGLAEGISSLNKLYDNGAGPYFDIVNLHYFEAPLRDGALGAVRNLPGLAYKVMARNGDGEKKIWITEIGCPGIPVGQQTNEWWLGTNPDEAAQARWVGQVYQILLRDAHVAKIFWAFFRDCSNHWNNGVDYFGLIRWDFSKKPAYETYKALTQEYRTGRAPAEGK